MSDPQPATFATDSVPSGIPAGGEIVWQTFAPPPTLLVPVSARSAGITEVKALSPGTAVEAGEALTQNAVEAAHVALAPLAGRVGDVVNACLTNGKRVTAIELHVSANAPAAALRAPPATFDAQPTEVAPSERGMWIDRIRQRGVWADRITSPDLIAQLHQSLRRPIDTVICNLLDSDREVPLNEAIVRDSVSEVIEGIAVLGRISGASRIWAVAPTGARRLFDALATLGKRAGLRVIALPNEYPLADPTMLLYRLVKRRLRPRRLPVEQGVLLFDGAAAAAVGRAVNHHAGEQPMLTVPLAIHDHVRRRTRLAMVPIGTPLSWVLAQLHCASERGLIELRGGALLRNMRVDPTCIVAGAELTVHVSLPARPINPDPCIRCSWCVEACPTRIQPAGLLEAAQQDNAALAERYGIEACIECGVCSYVCPSHLPLLEGIRKLKTASMTPSAQTVGGAAR